MAERNGRLLWSMGCASVLLTAVASHAYGAIIHRTVAWDVPADRAGIAIDLQSVQASSGLATFGGWHVRIHGESSLEFAARERDGPVAGLMRYSIDAGDSGPGNLPLDLVVGPFSDFGSGAVSFGDGAGQWRLNAANYFGFTFMSHEGVAHFGWGRIDIGADVGSRTIVEIAWQDMPGVGIQVGHTPAAGPLALLGIAALVGGPRRARLNPAAPAGSVR